jgi:hypothetical protein
MLTKSQEDMIVNAESMESTESDKEPDRDAMADQERFGISRAGTSESQLTEDLTEGAAMRADEHAQQDNALRGTGEIRVDADGGSELKEPPKTAFGDIE